MLYRLLFFMILFRASYGFDNIEIVYHVATMNHWEEIATEQLQAVQSSGLGVACDRITITVVGPHIEKLRHLVETMSFHAKARIIHAENDVRLCEFPGIEMVRQIALENKEAKILYFHSKGVSYQDNDRSRCIRSWRRYMEHFTIEHWSECIAALESQNACGVEWMNSRHLNSAQMETPGFFAGNFWWARADYLSTCQNIANHPKDTGWTYQHRYDCESFIATGKNLSPKSFHQSNVNLYHFNYTPEYYKTDENGSGRTEIVYTVFASPGRMKVFQEQMQLMQESGLLKACSQFTAVLLGPEMAKAKKELCQLPDQQKIRIIEASSRLDLGEFPAVELVKWLAHTYPAAKICYLHNAADSYFKQNIKPSASILQIIKRTLASFRKELAAAVQMGIRHLLGRPEPEQHATVTEWRECLDALESHSVCGAFWKSRYPKSAHFPDVQCGGHFKDNCWWARADYINSCHDAHYRSPFNLYFSRWRTRWLRQYAGDCHMFIGTGENLSVQAIEH